MTAPRDPVADLRRIAFLLERAHESTYRVRAFRGAAAALRGRDRDELAALAKSGELRRLRGVGDVTARCVAESLAGEEPEYLSRLQAIEGSVLADVAADLRAALRGDCHSHTDASDGGSPLAEMVETALELGHEYLVITDHSPRLTVANGLSPERLRAQLRDVAELNATLVDSGFRVLTGIEVDILDDGSLDQEPDLLAELDVVVASVHSKLRMPAPEMTERMLTAVANPHVDVLGHCTGRMVTGNRKRPESQFDADAVFAACADHGVAVEINSRPERLDPPKRLLRARGRRGLPVHDRHRRARARPARLARRRVRAGRDVRCAGGAGAEHLAGRAPARPDALKCRSYTGLVAYRNAELAYTDAERACTSAGLASDGRSQLEVGEVEAGGDHTGHQGGFRAEQPGGLPRAGGHQHLRVSRIQVVVHCIGRDVAVASGAQHDRRSRMPAPQLARADTVPA